MEIESIINEIKTILQADIAIFLNKAFIKRQDWEEGLQMLNRKSAWEQFPYDVLMVSTLNQLPEVVTTFISAWHNVANDNIVQQVINENHHHLGITFTPLRDVTSKRVGTLLIIKDFTEFSQSMKKVLLFVLGTCLLIGAGLFAIFNMILGRLEKQLHEAEFIQRNELQHQNTIRHLMMVVNCMGDALLVVNNHGVITEMNRSFRYMFDLDEAIRGRLYSEVLEKDLCELIERTLQNRHTAKDALICNLITLPENRMANASAARLNQDDEARIRRSWLSYSGSSGWF